MKIITYRALASLALAMVTLAPVAALASTPSTHDHSPLIHDRTPHVHDHSTRSRR
jgi:hypothetical protein